MRKKTQHAQRVEKYNMPQILNNHMDQQSSTLSYKSINFINTVETTNDKGNCHVE